MKYFLTLFIICLSICKIGAQNFDDYFIDRTLRLDCVFSGDKKLQSASLIDMSSLPKWNGRRVNLDKLKRDGLGQILVTDLETNKVIYRNAYSSLFFEWLTLEEASVEKRAFEHTLLIPYPKKKAMVTLSFRTWDGRYKPVMHHIVKPNDILIKPKGENNISFHNYIHRGDSTRYNCINVVIVAEGYQTKDMAKFQKAAKNACEQIFAHKPFGKYADRFNFIAVPLISEDSGVSVPSVNRWLKTPLSSHFNTFYQDRYLTTSNVRDMHDALAGIPYDHIIVLANTDVYGGGGIFNDYTLTTTGHEEFKPVVVHEFGHSFGGLADEYYYEQDLFSNTYNKQVEPWEPNITTLREFSSKWKTLLPNGTPIPTSIADKDKYPLGVYEGAGYSFKGIYRPAVDCRMKTNTCKEFCPACQDALEKLILFYTEEQAK